MRTLEASRAFRFCLDPTVKQDKVLARHVGAARFAFNQCLRLHLRARTASRAAGVGGGTGPVRVPWSGFDLINAFNGWKRSDRAGTLPKIAPSARPGRHKTVAADDRQGPRPGPVRHHHPRRGPVVDRHHRGSRGPAPARPAPTPPDGDAGEWVGVDRGLHALVVAGTAEGAETLRVDNPATLRVQATRARRLSKSVSRKQNGSHHRRRAIARLARHHATVRNRRQHLLHQVCGRLVKTHDRLVLEDLNVKGMVTNHHLARAISDAAWAELARQITYKQAWAGGQVLFADRWFASAKTCSACAHRKPALSLGERTYRCESCGLVIDRDLNAAANLAAWATDHTRGTAVAAGDRQADRPVTNAHRRDGPGPRTRAGETSPDDVGTDAQAPHPA
ncbi:RNA-guided endonuclease InsQ/TnpB family protein [Georgenia yuyongxinii]